jgi:RNase H-fold protein (predicted Holliday junction resolvase)
MRQMGEFILLTAQSAAEPHGITTQADIRHGLVGDEITALCHEIEADYLVVGRPAGQADQSDVFTHDLLHAFIARIEAQTGAKVVLAGEPDA